MFCWDGRLRMTRGDYGVSLSLHITEHCEACGSSLDPEDVIRAELLREGRSVFCREASYKEITEDDGMMELSLTKEEAETISLGLYAFRVVLLRGGQINNTLLASILEVLP